MKDHDCCAPAHVHKDAATSETRGDPERAERLRFLGSPTVRVSGHDVEPGADERTDYALSCRVFRTERSFSGQPDEHWIRDALVREARFTSTEVTAS